MPFAIRLPHVAQNKPSRVLPASEIHSTLFGSPFVKASDVSVIVTEMLKADPLIF
jgi:hypothetical protein